MSAPVKPVKFDEPPIAEVALGVQFAPLSGMRIAHLGALWTRFSDKFPTVEDHPPLPHVIEKFEPVSPSVGVEFELGMPVPRCWFIDPSGSELIQVQQDRFLHNWRRKEKGDPYPTYTKLIEHFRSELDKFSVFVNDNHLGELVFDQCEVTCVDHVEPGEVWGKHRDLDRVITAWSWKTSEPLTLEPENVRFDVRFVIPGDSGPIGRLHLNVTPAHRNVDKVPILALQWTARGSPLGPGVDGVFQFMGRAHHALVDAFVSLTTKEMHAVWKRVT